jgi:hypothetical protein
MPVKAIADCYSAKQHGLGLGPGHTGHDLRVPHGMIVAHLAALFPFIEAGPWGSDDGMSGGVVG